MEREPGHPQADIAASEALLDRAETELEALFGPERAPSGEQVGRSGRSPSRPRWRHSGHPAAADAGGGRSGRRSE